MQLSIVIPLLNEEQSLVELYNWIAKVMRSNSFSHEIIFIDDGSTDNSWK
ncbi:MAG TPA: glycosyltransferase, partial [Salegentibacter sp.]